MHLELVELLKCPNDHAPSVLVASADSIENRYVTNGLLGCPECLAEYAVRDGVTHFVEGGEVRAVADAAVVSASDSAVDRDVAMRLAAQLGLSPGHAVFALVGFSVEMALAMREIVPARVLVFNPHGLIHSAAELSSASLTAPFGVVACGDALPLVPRKFDGIAVAESRVSESLLDQCVQVLRPNARLVAPVGASVPRGMRELVRDEHVWVAEKEPVASSPIPLVRR